MRVDEGGREWMRVGEVMAIIVATGMMGIWGR